MRTMGRQGLSASHLLTPTMRWIRKSESEPLAVSMSGIKLGDRLLVIGSTDPALAAALAVKVGLTGRACVVADTPDAASSAAAAIESRGALVETFPAPLSALPFEPDAFDIVVLRQVLPPLAADARTAAMREVTRVVRPGGRCISIDDAKAGWLGRRAPGTASAPAMDALSQAGFRGVRTHAEREGVSFVEGVKPGSAVLP